MYCSASCIHVDFDKASFASLAELQLSPLYPCDTWPAEWLHSASAHIWKHCTVHKAQIWNTAQCTVHSAHIWNTTQCTLQKAQCKCTHLQTSKGFPALRPKSCAHKYCACHLSEIAECKQNLTPHSSFPFKDLPDQTDKYAKWELCKISNKI